MNTLPKGLPANCKLRDQLYIKYQTFDPLADPTYKITWSDWFVMLRSEYTHTEIEFPEIYGNISFSATNADGCKCARFKMIDYDKYPLRWKTILIPVTREQCDLIFAEACRMADVQDDLLAELQYDIGWEDVPLNDVYYGPNALKYDLIGLLSFTTRWTIIRPHSKWVWCVEACFYALLAGLPMMQWRAAAEGYSRGIIADKLHPESGYELIKAIYGKAA